MKTFTAIEYLAIDIANQYGLDKEEYETRIQWVKDNSQLLETQVTDAEEPELYMKAVMAFRKALQGLPIGHTVAFDAVCSGLQLMSVLTLCKSGCSLTGLIDPDKRTDAYTLITEYMNELLTQGIVISRKDAKRAVMTSLYGSQRVPKEVFGDRTPQYFAFYKTLQKYAKGAYWLLGLLKQVWQPHLDTHSWRLPDNHLAYVPNMVTKDARVTVSEIEYSMTLRYREPEAQEKGISLCANVIHSVDAYVLRTLVRRCNWNPYLKTALQVIYNYLNSFDGMPIKDDYHTEPLITHLNQAMKSDMVDSVIAMHINNNTVALIPMDYLLRLKTLLEEITSYEAFEFIPVHDSFACHPNHMNRLRYWYKEILAELAESNTLAGILANIIGDEVDLTLQGDPEVPNFIRQSNYGIC